MRVITEFDLKKCESWDKFNYSQEKGSIFQTAKMFELYALSNKLEPIIVFVVNEHEEFVGSLLAVVQKEHNGILGKFSARSIIWGGPVIKDNNLEVLDLILKEYNKKVKGKAIYTQFRNLWDWNNEEREVFYKNGFKFNEHLDILIDLSKPEKTLFLEMHKGRRKNIGRAERLPLTFSEVDSHDDFNKCIELIANNYKRVKLPYPENNFFINANNTLINQCKLKTFVVKFQEEIISCRLVLCYKELVYDWYAGTDDNHLDKYPNDFLPWKIFEWSKKNGFKTFDFGGAGRPNEEYGVREYKLKFGGELHSFGRFEKINNKVLYIIGKVGFYLLMKIRPK